MLGTVAENYGSSEWFFSYASCRNKSAMNLVMAISDITEIRLNEAGAAARWDELVKGCPEADVYHRAAYILAGAEVEHSQALGLVISRAEQRYLLPLLLRPLTGPSGEAWFDISTPYGYGGIAGLGADPTLSRAVDLLYSLRDWCVSKSFVSCLIRLHPLLEQDCLLDAAKDCDFVIITRRGKTTAVPLQAWDNERESPAELSKGRRSDLSLARRNLRVTWNMPCDHNGALAQLQI